MPRTAFKVDLSRPPEAAEIRTHNRWHPDIPMVEMMKPGDEFRVECFDWTGGQIENDDSANDVRDVDLTKVHYLSGPFGVEGAEPGDLLVVDLLDLGYLPASPWGFTGIFARENGGGFLVDHYPQARKACWGSLCLYKPWRPAPGVRGFPWYLYHLPPRPRRARGRHRPSRPHRLPALAGAARPGEQARGRTA